MAIDSGLKTDRNIDQSRLVDTPENRYETLNALGTNMLGQYKDPKLTGFQEKELSGYSDTMKSATDESMKASGLQGSGQEIAAMREWADTVQGVRYDLKQIASHETWARGLQAIGLSRDEAVGIASKHAQHRAESAQAFSQLIGVIAMFV